MASAENEPFYELRVITLKSHFNDLCQELAMSSVEYWGEEDDSTWLMSMEYMAQHDDSWADRVQQQAFNVIDTGKVFVKEFVDVKIDMSTTVALDVDEITDDSITTALAYLERSAIPGKTLFGESITYTSSEIREMLRHVPDTIR
jgi:hypothetical protein